MQTPYAPQVVADQVKQAMSSVLLVPVEEMDLDARLVADLDADSLDLVELRAVLERQLNLTLPTRSVIDHAILLTQDEARFVDAGRLTGQGAWLLRNSLFAFGEEQVCAGMGVGEIFDRMTVRNWISLCQNLLSRLPPACPECGGAKAALNARGRLACVGCGAPIRPPAGDEVMAAHLRTLLF